MFGARYFLSRLYAARFWLRQTTSAPVANVSIKASLWVGSAITSNLSIGSGITGTLSATRTAITGSLEVE